jgi:RecB family exonuclease
MRLTIYPTARALSSAIAQQNQDCNIVSKAITIGDFFTKAIIVKDRVAIDDNSRLLLLNESIDFSKLAKLGFEKDFISFIKNSEFIFKFFDEIFAQKIPLEQIQNADIYTEFSDHLDILTHIYHSYKQNLIEHGYYDRATIEEYSINRAFFENFSSIELYLEGILTNVEYEILIALSCILNTTIIIEYNRFNTKMVSKFFEYGIVEHKYGKYRLNISDKIVDSYEAPKSDTTYNIEAFSNPILQASYIFKKIYDYVEIDKCEASRIAVVLPEESFATVLRDFDSKNNLNFAMGIPFSQSSFFKSLQAIYLYSIEYNQENLQRVDRLNLSETISELKQNSSDMDSLAMLSWLIDRLKQGSSEKEIEIIDSISYKIDKFSKKLKRYSFKDILSFALRLFNEQKIDDTRGGKIKVIGLLESRSIEFDAIIIPSFNEGVVPKVSTKDIFLNSKIKSLVNLPTKKDREELQKYYYTRLFNSSKYVSICYVEAEDRGASRFIKELGLKQSSIQDSRYKEILFDTPATIRHFDSDEIIQNSWQEMELSATRFSTFLKCKRKFYYQYIKKLDAPSEENRDKLTLGNIFHNAFSKVIDSSYSDAGRLSSAIKSEVLDNLKDINLKFDIYKWLKYIDKFAQYEVARFNSGVQILEKEQTHKMAYNDITLMGRIDRVDIKDDRLSVIDYKIKENIKLDSVKNYENSTDFQLEFYYLLLKHRYDKEIENAYVYDVKNAKLVVEEALIEKLGILDDKLHEYKADSIEISKCEDKNNCRYCAYKIICNRD